MYPYYIEYEGNELSLLDERAIKEAMGFEFEKVKPNQNAVGKLCLYPVTSENGWNRYYYCFNGKSDVKLHNGITDGTSKEQLLSILNNNFIAAQFNDDMFFFTAFINNEEIDYSKLKFDGIPVNDEYRITAVRQGIDAYCRNALKSSPDGHYTVISYGCPSGMELCFNSVTVYIRKKGILSSLFRK